MIQPRGIAPVVDARVWKFAGRSGELRLSSGAADQVVIVRRMPSAASACSRLRM